MHGKQYVSSVFPLLFKMLQLTDLVWQTAALASWCESVKHQCRWKWIWNCHCIHEHSHCVLLGNRSHHLNYEPQWKWCRPLWTTMAKASYFIHSILLHVSLQTGAVHAIFSAYHCMDTHTNMKALLAFTSDLVPEHSPTWILNMPSPHPNLNDPFQILCKIIHHIPIQQLPEGCLEGPLCRIFAVLIQTVKFWGSLPCGNETFDRTKWADQHQLNWREELHFLMR